MEEAKILRINELAKKAKNEGLSEAEKKERKELRDEYIASVRRNFRATLDNIKFVDKN